MTYAVVSDLHCHNWSAFSTIGVGGINSRLQLIIDELWRAARELDAAGGTELIIAGDLFHVRGAIAPEVFNPVHQAIYEILDAFGDLRILAIPGNHDLASRETTELGNAMQTLDALKRFVVITSPYLATRADYNLLFIPWMSHPDKVMQELTATAVLMTKADLDKTDVFIHCGVNGVLTGMPDHGLDAPKLAALGFRRIFAGHYHNHKVMEGGKVISIGATTHHTWGDIGTRAGFLLVDDTTIEYRASHAPSFVEITGETDEDEIPLIVDGNYVRVRGMKLTDLEANALRTELIGMGAKGVSIEVARAVTSARSVPTKALSLDASVNAYIDDLAPDNIAEVKLEAAAILAKVRSVAE